MYQSGWDGRIAPNVQLAPHKPTIIAGPCMLENLELGLKVGSFLKQLCDELNIQYIFKSSYDKANRTAAGTERGPGLEHGLKNLEIIRTKLGCPVLTDVHSPLQATAAGQVCDVIQIPAFLSDQRELLIAAAKTQKTVQVKKGQHTHAGQMIEIGQFLNQVGCKKVILCERGQTFGYNDLIVDYRTLIAFREAGFAVAFDCTHAAQLPGAGKGQSSGLRYVIPGLARAGVAVGIDVLFIEVHETPEKALSDAATQLDFTMAKQVITEAARLWGCQ